MGARVDSVLKFMNEHPQVGTIGGGAALGAAGYYGTKWLNKRNGISEEDRKKGRGGLNPWLLASLGAAAPLAADWYGDAGLYHNMDRNRLGGLFLPTSRLDDYDNRVGYTNKLVNRVLAQGKDPNKVMGPDPKRFSGDVGGRNVYKSINSASDQMLGMNNRARNITNGWYSQ